MFLILRWSVAPIARIPTLKDKSKHISCPDCNCVTVAWILISTGTIIPDIKAMCQANYPGPYLKGRGYTLYSKLTMCLYCKCVTVDWILKLTLNWNGMSSKSVEVTNRPCLIKVLQLMCQLQWLIFSYSTYISKKTDQNYRFQKANSPNIG